MSVWSIVLIYVGNRLIGLGELLVKRATMKKLPANRLTVGDPYRTIASTKNNDVCEVPDPFNAGIRAVENATKLDEEFRQRFLASLDWNTLVPQFFVEMDKISRYPLSRTVDDDVILLPFDMQCISQDRYQLVSQEFSKMLNQRGIKSRTLEGGALIFSPVDFKRYLGQSKPR
jgi:hypothetical protein